MHEVIPAPGRAAVHAQYERFRPARRNLFARRNLPRHPFGIFHRIDPKRRTALVFQRKPALGRAVGGARSEIQQRFGNFRLRTFPARHFAQFGQVTDTGSAHHDRPFEPPSGNGQITRINERSPHLGSGQVTDESDLSLRTGRQYGRSFGPQKGKRFSEFRPQPHLVR